MTFEDFEKVIFNKIKDYIEGQLSEEKYGFKTSRSTIDFIFTTFDRKTGSMTKQLILIFISEQFC